MLTVEDERLTAVVRAVTGRPSARLGTVERSPVGGRVDNMTTAAIERLRGTLSDGTAWSVVVKVLRPVTDAPQFALIPPEFHDVIRATLDWLDEPRVYRSRLASVLPDGLRMPQLFAVDDDAKRITLWLEDVPDREPWTQARYRRTAALLGRMSGRTADEDVRGAVGLGRRDIGTMFHGKVLHSDLPAQSDESFWARPEIAAVVDPHHRRDLFRLAELMPSLLAHLDALPEGVCHGDASPNNFLEPGDGTAVAIDWSYAAVMAIGSDLAQLLAGRFDSGEEEPGCVGDIAATILDAFCEGLAAEGAVVERGAVEKALATHLAIRSVFPALLLEGDDPVVDEPRRHVLEARAALARFGLDLALRHGADATVA